MRQAASRSASASTRDQRGDHRRRSRPSAGERDPDDRVRRQHRRSTAGTSGPRSSRPPPRASPGPDDGRAGLLDQNVERRPARSRPAAPPSAARRAGGTGRRAASPRARSAPTRSPSRRAGSPRRERRRSRPRSNPSLSGGSAPPHEAPSESGATRVCVLALASRTRSSTSRVPSSPGRGITTWRADKVTGARLEVSCTTTVTGLAPGATGCPAAR